MEKKLRTLIIIGVSIWMLFILVGVFLSILNGFTEENFGIIFIGLTAFQPEFMFANESNKLYLYGWSIVMAIILITLAYYGWVKNDLKCAIVFFGLTVLSFIVGIIRVISNLHIA